MAKQKGKGSNRPKVRLALRKKGAKLKSARSVEKVGANFHAAVSLGSICLAARFLERHGIRKQKFPFDWMYGSPRLVRHCLSDNFKQFLSESQLETWRDKRGTGHKLYERMQLGKRSAVWPHHVLTNKVDKDSFKRAVKRFQTLLGNEKSRKLFVLVQNIGNEAMLRAVRFPGPAKLEQKKVPIPAGPSYEQGSLEEVRRLFGALRQHSRGSFHFDVVNLIVPGVSSTSSRPSHKKVYSEGTRGRDCTMAVHELYCRGNNTGLFFKDDRDHSALERLLTQGRSFNITDVDDESAPMGFADKEAVEQRKARRGMKRKASAAGAASSAAGKPTRRLRGKAAKRGSSLLGLDRKLTIEWENPKKPGSSAHARYQRYRRAQTVGEFLKLGGVPGDLRYDKKQGYLRFVK